MLGKTRLERPKVRAVLQENVQNTSDRRNFVRVRVEKRDDGYVARTTGEQGSGILTSVSRANGLLIVPESIPLLRAGEMVEVQMVDWGESG